MILWQNFKNDISIINSFDTGKKDKQAPNVDSPNWKINDIGIMTMYNFHTDSNHPYDSIEYKKAAGHEFGHLIGLAHAYEPNKGSETPTYVSKEIYISDIMWIGDDVSFNDMEMVFLAALYNEKQYFNGPNISEAITMRTKNV